MQGKKNHLPYYKAGYPNKCLVLLVVQFDQSHNTQHAFPTRLRWCGYLENWASKCRWNSATEEYTKINCTEGLVVTWMTRSHVLKRCLNITLSASVQPFSSSFKSQLTHHLQQRTLLLPKLAEMGWVLLTACFTGSSKKWIDQQ